MAGRLALIKYVTTSTPSFFIKGLLRFSKIWMLQFSIFFGLVQFPEESRAGLEPALPGSRSGQQPSLFIKLERKS